jgi:hypothetical protein
MKTDFDFGSENFDSINFNFDFDFKNFFKIDHAWLHVQGHLYACLSSIYTNKYSYNDYRPEH